ncbi:hypothetical protein Ancab_033852 [Ancistrocladus abbreviatus]
MDHMIWFDMYLYNHLVKKGWHTTAEIFAKEANVDVGSGAVGSSEHLLSDWWSIFYDSYFAKEVQQNATTGKKLMGTGPLSQQSRMPAFEMNKRCPVHLPSKWRISGQQETSFLGPKMSDEQWLKRLAGNFGTNAPLRINESLNLSSSARTETSMRNPCIPPQQNFNLSPLQQEIDHLNLRATTRSMPLYGMPKKMSPKIHGPNSTVMHYGDSTTLNSWLLTHAPQGQQEHLAHLIAPASGRAMSPQLGSSSTLDTRNMMLPRNNMDGKVEQKTATALHLNRNDSVATPRQRLPPIKKRVHLAIAGQGARLQTAEQQDKRSKQFVEPLQKVCLPPDQNESTTSQGQHLPNGGKGVNLQVMEQRQHGPQTGGGTRTFSSILATESSLASNIPSKTDQVSQLNHTWMNLSMLPKRIAVFLRKMLMT